MEAVWLPLEKLGLGIGRRIGLRKGSGSRALDIYRRSRLSSTELWTSGGHGASEIMIVKL